MKTIAKISVGHNQLLWVVLLLSIAVLLPTICLLWFMSRAVRNERLAVKQELTNVYQRHLGTFGERADALWMGRIDSLGQTAELEPIEMFARLADAGDDGRRVCDTVVIYDSSGRAAYPIAADGQNADEFPDEFNKAWAAEFTENDFARAIRLYGQIATYNFDDYVTHAAMMGKIRCLRKSSQIEEAIALCRELAYGQPAEIVGPSSASLITRARLLLVELKEQTTDGPARSDLEELIGSAVNYSPGSGPGFLLMSSQTRIFFLRKAIEIVAASRWSDEMGAELSRAKSLLATEELASAFLTKYGASEAPRQWSPEDAEKLVSLLSLTLSKIEEFEWDLAEPLKRQISTLLDSFGARDDSVSPDAAERPALAALLELWPENNVRRLELPEETFAMYHGIGNRACLFLQRADALRSDFESSADDLVSLGVSYRITDASGAYVAGLESPDKPAFLKTPLGKFFPGWHVEIHFKDVDIFEATADRQKMIYVWAGLLAIAVMLSAGLLATRVVGKQIKTNRLKNDFIATVSHELKTPLASMRVLVDTLLEGSYRDQQQVTEYLELVSKENERLTGLIDNFLSFSRMERNKQTFAMTRTSSGQIAHDAAEAVKTKFSTGQCVFDADIAEELPDVMADRDAMITVLVNLLDNAYKYSYDDKRIELRAFAQDGSVCFSVRDNGRGMSRRSARKIFGRFYQVDRSLSRGAEGCGLGLSIAKFIVDAHKGTIDVESKPGEGSTFTVCLNSI
ncbi:MAG: GHKL domain-containing protein [Phycisphaerales bacterium]|nr:MAG: GHKL domain-containing protein [Phycisphaerales bacterium]